MKKTLQETTKTSHDSLMQLAVVKKEKQEAMQDPSIEKGEIIELRRQIDGLKGANFRKCMQEHSRTYEKWKGGLTLQVDNRRSTKCRRSKGGRNSEVSGTVFRPWSQDPARYPRVIS